MARAAVSRSRRLRFDLCSEPGPATVDLDGLLEEARWGLVLVLETVRSE